jgi:proteasome activator-like protein
MATEPEKSGIIVVGPDGEPQPPGGLPKEMVQQPAKLFRIGGMIRELLEELRRAPLDAEGRRRARDMHLRAIEELKAAVSADLREELEAMSLPFSGEVPTQPELTVAQAILAGWFEGVFHGMQAFLFAQQGQRSPMNPMQRPGTPSPADPMRGPGQYL